MIRKRGLAAAIFLLILVNTYAQDQDAYWYLDKTIVDIRFENLERVSENELRGLVRDYVGQNFTDMLSWEIMALLYGLDYFDYVETKIDKGDPEGNTIVLIFSVTEKPYISEISFLGNDRVRRFELLETILTREKEILDTVSLNSDVEALKRLYLEKGFADIQIDTRTQLSEDGKTLELFFDIEEGIQTRISQILLEGNEVYSDNKVLLNLMELKESSFLNKGLYNEAVLQNDIQVLEAFYLERGFIDANIENVDKQITVNPEDGLKEMTITIHIHEGNQFTFGQIDFSGNTLYSDQELLDMMYIEQGDKANLLKFERNYTSIMELYQQNGYIFNNFNYEMNRDDENQIVSFSISIIERDRAHIESIIINGNSKTREYVIRRELPVEVGDVFSRAKLESAVMNLYNTGFFESINPIPYQGSEDLLMDLELNVVEGQTADIMFGITFTGGSEFPISGQVKWNDKNFLGTGKNFGVETNFSFDNQTLSLQYNEPWLFGHRWSGGFDLSYTRKKAGYVSQDADGNGIPDPYLTWEEYTSWDNSSPTDNFMEYDSHSISGGFSTGYTWMKPFARLSLAGSLRTGFKYIDYEKNDYQPFSQSLVENYHTWQYYDSISTKFSWDNRNRVYEPSEGYIVSQSLILAGIMDVSITEYVKSVSRVGFYHTLFSFDLKEEKQFTAIFDFNSAFSVLVEKPWKEHELDLDSYGLAVDGMFIGRGWDSDNGGKALWDTSLTVKYPVFPNILTVDTFLDAVGLWKSDEELTDMGIEDFRFSLGGGIRFANPAFPIGIYMVKKFNFNEDYSLNWTPDLSSCEFPEWGLDLVVSFEIDMY